MPRKVSSRTPNTDARTIDPRVRELGDPKTAPRICFSATLFRPAATVKAVSWTFLTLPKEASAKLPRRGMTSVEGNQAASPFRLHGSSQTARKGNWLKVDRKRREAAGAEAKNVLTLEVDNGGRGTGTQGAGRSAEGSRRRPDGARKLWSAITPVAPEDWIHWIVSAKQKQRRARVGSGMPAIDARRREAASLLGTSTGLGCIAQKPQPPRCR